MMEHTGCRVVVMGRLFASALEICGNLSGVLFLFHKSEIQRRVYFMKLRIIRQAVSTFPVAALGFS